MPASIKTRALGYTLAASLAATSVAISLASAVASSPNPSAAHVRAPAPGSAVAQLSRAATVSFGVFARPTAGSEDVRLVGEVVGGDNAAALDPASVRLAQSSSGVEVFVAGDSESVCLVARVPGKALDGGCGPEAAAAAPATPEIGSMAYPPGEVSHPGGRLAVTALFPDGAKDATVTSSAGVTEPLSIVNNTVAFIAGEDAALGWTGPDGHAYSSPIPH